MQAVNLSITDLIIAGLLVGILALVNFLQGTSLAKLIVVAALRCATQLVLIGLVLKLLFDHINLALIASLATVMLVVAGREVVARQQHPLQGLWGFGTGTLAMFVSSFTLAIFALTLIVNADPWYTPQYAIPLLGMLLGNTMNGVSISLDRLTHSAYVQRSVIEQRLLLGETSAQAFSNIRQESLRAGMIPIINAMTTAGVVNLPGMMTGQILAGSPPVEAVKYQILILFLISVGTGFGVKLALWLAARRLFDQRERLRLDNLRLR